MDDEFRVIAVVSVGVIGALVLFGPAGDYSFAERAILGLITSVVLVGFLWIRPGPAGPTTPIHLGFWTGVVLPLAVLWALLLFTSDDQARMEAPVRVLIGLIATLGLAGLWWLDQRLRRR